MAATLDRLLVWWLQRGHDSEVMEGVREELLEKQRAEELQRGHDSEVMEGRVLAGLAGAARAASTGP